MLVHLKMLLLLLLTGFCNRDGAEEGEVQLGAAEGGGLGRREGALVPP